MTRPREPIQERVSTPGGFSGETLAAAEFLERVFHELRTPLSAAVMWIDIWKRGTPAQQRSAVSAIERSMQAQVRVIEAVLDFARCARGTIELAGDELELVEPLREAVVASEPQARSKGILLVATLPESVGAVVGDAVRLARVFTSLLANAVKFTPAGGVVRVRAGRSSPHLFVCVEDTGRGLSAAMLARVFEPQVEVGGPREARGGLGLNLALSRRIVELHGGRLEAESAGEGHGSTFTVLLPTAHP
ncbi:MAG TPA: HAMP domain-containing sensor histidine kinase [Polyangiaceae bacterium]|nr:HAMP domain-containing sensor histidine kinase [Polyangiaceae bacterium]